MKKIIAAALLSIALFSCTDTKKQEKDLLNDVIKTHDRVMSKDELIMINKMQLDTLLKETKDTAFKAAAIKLATELETADAKMENWMHNFDAENKNKSHEEIMTYLTDQKKQIESIDKQLSTAITSSNNLIKQSKTK
jgi:thioester reductase-like protein